MVCAELMLCMMDLSPTSGVPDQTDHHYAIRLACQACQRKKIKCDRVSRILRKSVVHILLTAGEDVPMRPMYPIESTMPGQLS